MGIYKLSPDVESFEWGGTKLKEYGKKAKNETDKIAQTWELCANGDHQSLLTTGKDAGITLGQYIKDTDGKAAGTIAKEFDYFPITIKMVDNQNVSAIQVNPDPEKVNLIYVLSAKEDAVFYCGLNEKIEREQMVEKIQNGTLQDLIRSFAVKAVDAFLIEPGTVFAIGDDIQYISIQQDSPLKEFSFEQVLDAITMDVADVEKEAQQEVIEDGNAKTVMLANSDVFTTFKTELNGTVKIDQDEDSFGSIVMIEGEAVINSDGGEIPASKGDTFFIDAGTKNIEIQGKGTYLYTFLSELDA